MSRDSMGKITWAIVTNFYRHNMASMSFSATCITSMPKKNPKMSITLLIPRLLRALGLEALFGPLLTVGLKTVAR